MNIEEQRGSARPIRDGIAEFASIHGATHFFTLKMGLHCETKFDPDRELRPRIGCLLERYARRVRGVPNRLDPTHEDLPFMIVIPEMTGKWGDSDPHCHGFMTLEADEEVLCRGLLREAWGVDMTVGAERMPAALPEKGLSREQRSFLPNLSVPFRTNPSGWLLRGARYTPSFDLQALTTDHGRPAGYMTKKTINPIIWTVPELLDSKRPFQPRFSKSPANVRH